MRLLTFLVGFLMVGSSSLTAQHLCGTHPYSEGFELQQSRLLHNLRAVAEGTVTPRDVSFVPIRFHVGAKNDGTGRISIGKVLDQLCELNEDYAPYDIQFFLAGGNINFINNTTFYENHSATQNSVMNIQKDPRALNVFIVESANTGSNPGEGVTLAYYNIPRDWIVITKTYIRDNDATLSHEIGHFFSLMHTFNGWECGGYNTENVNAPTMASCGSPATERANGSNCNNSGDFICDTPPDYNNGLGWNNCNFSLNVLDPQGNAIDPDERNYMSYFLSCSDDEYNFSDQQNAVIQQDLNSFSRNYLRLDPVPNVPVITEGTTLNYPIEGDVTDNYNYVNFQWDAVPGATAYFLEIDRVATFSISPIRLIVYGNSKVITELTSDRNYYWRVRPFNAMSGCAPISSLVSFRTGTGVTNVETPDFVEEFTVFPNPVFGQSELQIRLSSQEAFNGKIEVLDITGRPTGVQRQYEFATGAQQLSLDIDGLTSGIYLLQITTTEGRLTQKVVVAN